MNFWLKIGSSSCNGIQISNEQMTCNQYCSMTDYRNFDSKSSSQLTAVLKSVNFASTLSHKHLEIVQQTVIIQMRIPVQQEVLPNNFIMLRLMFSYFIHTLRSTHFIVRFKINNIYHKTMTICVEKKS